MHVLLFLSHSAIYMYSFNTVYDSMNAREGNDLCVHVPNNIVPDGNDDDVIINYITDMDLGEGSNYAGGNREPGTYCLRMR